MQTTWKYVCDLLYFSEEYMVLEGTSAVFATTDSVYILHGEKGVCSHEMNLHWDYSP